MARFRAIFSFHLLRIYGADLFCLVYDGGSDVHFVFVSFNLSFSRAPRSYAPHALQIFYSSRGVIDASIYSSRELIQQIKNLDKEGHDGAE